MLITHQMIEYDLNNKLLV